MGGDWQQMVIEAEAADALFSGDAIHLLAHTGNRMEVQGTSVGARWSEAGAWQTFRVERKAGDGPLMPNDTIFLQAHAGRYVEVDGVAVKASWFEKGAWQALTVEKAAARRLITNTSEEKLSAHMGGEQLEHSELVLI